METFVDTCSSLCSSDDTITKQEDKNEEVISANNKEAEFLNCHGNLTNEKQENSEKEYDYDSSTRPLAGQSTIHLAPDDEFSANKVNPQNSNLLPEWKDLDKMREIDINVRSKFYIKNQVKYPSAHSLYECVAFDLLDSDQRLENIKDKVSLQNLVDDTAKARLNDDPVGVNNNFAAPDIFVVTVALPKDSPQLRYTKSKQDHNDDRSTILVLYLKMKNTTRRVLNKLNVNTHANDFYKEEEAKISPAVKLLEQWCQCTPKDSTFSGRFKVIASSPNADQILPKAMAKYNGKPFLIKRTGVTGIHSFNLNSNSTKHIREFDVNLHAFPYIAKQAFSYVNRNLAENLVMRLAFVIEGRDVTELPEVLLGGVETMVIHRTKIIQATQFFTINKV